MPIALFYRQARHSLGDRPIPPLLLNPPGYLWWDGEEFWFVPEAEYFRYRKYEPTDVSGLFYGLDETRRDPGPDEEIPVERELMDLELPRLMQTREEYDLSRNYMLSISDQQREE